MTQFKIIVLVNNERETKYVRAETLEEAKEQLIKEGYIICPTCNE